MLQLSARALATNRVVGRINFKIVLKCSMTQVIPTSDSLPVVLGVATLDAIHHGKRVELGFGGVALNVACRLGLAGARPVFVCPGHGPETNAGLRCHLETRGVTWQALPLELPLPFFEAWLNPDGSVRRERHHDNGACAPINPQLLSQAADQLLQGALLLTSSDLHRRSLKALRTLCREHGQPFYLLSASLRKARRIPGLQPDLLALNLAELQAITRPEGDDLLSLCRAAASLVDPAGACLLTLGPAGALLIRPQSRCAWHQPVPPLDIPNTVGAGDTLFAALISHRLRSPTGPDWSAALAHATGVTLDFLARGRSVPPLPPQAVLSW